MDWGSLLVIVLAPAGYLFGLIRGSRGLDAVARRRARRIGAYATVGIVVFLVVAALVPWSTAQWLLLGAVAAAAVSLAVQLARGRVPHERRWAFGAWAAILAVMALSVFLPGSASLWVFGGAAAAQLVLARLVMRRGRAGGNAQGRT